MPEPKCVASLDSFGTRCNEPAERFVRSRLFGEPYVILPYCKRHFPEHAEETTLEAWVAYYVTSGKRQ